MEALCSKKRFLTIDKARQCHKPEYGNPTNLLSSLSIKFNKEILNLRFPFFP
jgi:hypothetical protein